MEQMDIEYLFHDPLNKNRSLQDLQHFNNNQTPIGDNCVMIHPPSNQNFSNSTSSGKKIYKLQKSTMNKPLNLRSKSGCQQI